MTVRNAVVAGLACAGAALAGCGEKKELTSTPAPAPGESTRAPTGEATSTAPVPVETEPEPKPKPPPPRDGAPNASPEDQEGGAGDEIPARSQAMITGRRGRLAPRLVQVPPFIAIRVELRSADGGRYRLSGAGKVLRAGGRVSAMAATFDGLRPGKRLVLTGTGGRVVVEASAEPGP